jgi:DNA-binding protein HU-beta
MNKGELTEAIAERLECSKSHAGKALDAVLDEIVHQVANGERVVVPGFGTFETVHREERTGRSPQTGAEIKIAASTAPKFKPGATFKAAVKS